MATNQTKTNKTAQAAYQARVQSIAAKLEALQEMLASHQMEFDGKNWGMVGDLAAIDELLGQALGGDE